MPCYDFIEYYFQIEDGQCILMKINRKITWMQGK